MKTIRHAALAFRLRSCGLGLVLLFNSAYGLWLVLKPVNHTLFVALDDWGVTLGLLTMSLICLAALGK